MPPHARAGSDGAGSVTALQILAGGQVTPTTSPLPFHAYPVFVATMAGWIWALAGRVRPQ